MANASLFVPASVFIGMFPAGVVYSDRQREEHGDYKRLAFLPYSTGTLQLAADCPPELVGWITADAARNYAPGTVVEVSTCGQTVTIGGIVW